MCCAASLLSSGVRPQRHRRADRAVLPPTRTSPEGNGSHGGHQRPGVPLRRVPVPRAGTGGRHHRRAGAQAPRRGVEPQARRPDRPTAQWRGGVVSVRVAVPPLVGAVLAGCSAPDPAPPPPAQPPSVVQAPEDSGLRPVTMTYRDGLAYAPEETAAQALCHALSREEWSDLLGGGDVGRTVRFDGGTACVAISGGLT